ncbi:unnamed protein product [Pleuronectes platessa]|uniref:Uncharacterized protein n=1 Tax=Pleuronectes platessa TaxID=8262 RepID=A0A9N7TUZ2_PLEPL|nr:unnamed protein product [Pleuronectes platessa]
MGHAEMTWLRKKYFVEEVERRCDRKRGAAVHLLWQPQTGKEPPSPSVPGAHLDKHLHQMTRQLKIQSYGETEQNSQAAPPFPIIHSSSPQQPISSSTPPPLPPHHPTDHLL